MKFAATLLGTCLLLVTATGEAYMLPSLKPSHLMAPDGKQVQLRVRSPEQAASMASGRYPGKVLKVGRSTVNGNPGYRIKMVTNDGKVFYVAVDAVTGSVGRD
ncbi:PepSY domain-containing protein [Shewanella cyperi]|uniref:PepSY domain-containing protein n=1 Tax=Shewanella cyperi TaxID=2814292 RepID=A0A974XSU1_9GAMM|nr:PepSY domain-containing protein [Shewanella cyperi]QSX29814.1 PepSY domain-containing protein [Shewanella cyperi]